MFVALVCLSSMRLWRLTLTVSSSYPDKVSLTPSPIMRALKRKIQETMKENRFVQLDGLQAATKQHDLHPFDNNHIMPRQPLSI